MCAIARIVNSLANTHIVAAMAFPSGETHWLEIRTRVSARQDETASFPNYVGVYSQRLSDGLGVAPMY